MDKLTMLYMHFSKLVQIVLFKNRSEIQTNYISGVIRIYQDLQGLAEACWEINTAWDKAECFIFVHTSTGIALCGILYFQSLLNHYRSWAMDSSSHNIKQAS